MSIFNSIKTAIFGHKAASAPTQSASPAPTPSHAPAPEIVPSPAAAAAGVQVPAPATIDVGTVLSEMASLTDGGGGNYQTSIVDLLKLLNLDSSVAARKELADELGIHAGADGSAEQNIALHRAVMDKLAENRGVVTDDLRS